MKTKTTKTKHSTRVLFGYLFALLILVFSTSVTSVLAASAHSHGNLAGLQVKQSSGAWAPWTPDWSYANGFYDEWDYSDDPSGGLGEYGIDVPLTGSPPIYAPEPGKIIAYIPCHTWLNPPCWDPGRIVEQLTSGAVVAFGHVDQVAPVGTILSGGEQIATVGANAPGGPHVEFMYSKTGAWAHRSDFLPPAPVSPINGCPRNYWNTSGGTSDDPCTVLTAYMHGGGPPPPPSTPNIVGMGGDNTNVVTVTWSASSGGQGGVSYYEVFRLNIYGNPVQIGTTPPGTLTFNDTSLRNGGVLTYQVVAVDQGGQSSSPSAPASALWRAPGQSGLAWFSVGKNVDYCRRTGVPPFANQHLQCTTFNGKTWSTSDSGGNNDWGYDTQRAWLNAGGKPTFCRRTGVPPFANQHLQCTTFNGKAWSTSDSGGSNDWGYPVGAAWIVVNNNPVYCRRTGVLGYYTQHLQCTTFNGKTWSTSDSGGGYDWGYDVGAAWVATKNAAMYCRRTGVLGYYTQHLQCTTFNGKTWSTSDSGGGYDWGYDVGVAWIVVNNNPVYCRRTGVPPFANQDLQCTTFNGKTWSTSDSGGGNDWGYDVGAAWVATKNAAMYCRRTGVLGYYTQHLQCTTFNGTSWSTSDSGGGNDWGYDVGADWIGSNIGAVYCRRTGVPPFANQDLQCTTFNGTSWSTSDSGGGYDWGYDI